jgi:nucleoside phosphorylase
MSTDALILLVALKAEAKPLIRAFGLRRKQPDGAFPRYVNGPLTLLLTGSGTQAAGKATQFSLELSATKPFNWINLGVAGHARLAPGSCLLAERIKEIHSGEEWQLQPPDGMPDLIRGSLHCVTKPETNYLYTVGYDMESAAIADTLSKTGLLPRLQVLKIISDNPDHPARGISAKMVSDLIEAQLPVIEALISRLQPHA